jgi:hypothetical protein
MIIIINPAMMQFNSLGSDMAYGFRRLFVSDKLACIVDFPACGIFICGAR